MVLFAQVRHACYILASGVHSIFSVLKLGLWLACPNSLHPSTTVDDYVSSCLSSRSVSRPQFETEATAKIGAAFNRVGRTPQWENLKTSQTVEFHSRWRSDAGCDHNSSHSHTMWLLHCPMTSRVFEFCRQRTEYRYFRGPGAALTNLLCTYAHGLSVPYVLDTSAVDHTFV
ncbi:hypothetical protein PHLGIDRAFT_429752 [Phlebiopsis gigantea 11061_1 CR5-6]|uniref:Uncharacterized protein n=1 Tax=Phlebiopsis gigantea (strain 11061_1 CR5-6) TaxID=745531 RepID=A0A0C3PL97_PHLG1|nr:hypothetical protein PHLGIDRAFT_429752 [Phlebiopsis gigantea 11061_1 CR5-6]